jgi:hypothetical protein
MTDTLSTETAAQILGVRPDADEETVKQAYRERVKEAHPDISDAVDADEQFKRVQQARDQLLQPPDGESTARSGGWTNATSKATETATSTAAEATTGTGAADGPTGSEHRRARRDRWEEASDSTAGPDWGPTDEYTTAGQKRGPTDDRNRHSRTGRGSSRHGSPAATGLLGRTGEFMRGAPWLSRAIVVMLAVAVLAGIAQTVDRGRGSLIASVFGFVLVVGSLTAVYVGYGALVRAISEREQGRLSADRSVPVRAIIGANGLGLGLGMLAGLGSSAGIGAAFGFIGRALAVAAVPIVLFGLMGASLGRAGRPACHRRTRKRGVTPHPQEVFGAGVGALIASVFLFIEWGGQTALENFGLSTGIAARPWIGSLALGPLDVSLASNVALGLLMLTGLFGSMIALMWYYPRIARIDRTRGDRGARYDHHHIAMGWDTLLAVPPAVLVWMIAADVPSIVLPTSGQLTRTGVLIIVLALPALLAVVYSIGRRLRA